MPKKRKRESTVTRSQLKEEQDGGDVKSARKILKPKSKLDSSTVQYTHWLMKSEPESRFENGVDVKFGIEDLKVCPNQTACWDGVRNYQARNFMRDQMRKGHKVFFYHSNTKEPGIAGVCEVVKESYVDHTQFDSKDPHFDSSSKKDNPKWFMVDVQFKRMMKRYIRLSELKALHLKHKESGGPLKNVALFTKARLSVQPLTQEEWDFILSLEDKE
ncbi:thymocyte nuclear protein 1-like isoform X1 [Mercenaria mercenaria]|uniref:thymocyte nuclear protein 1-like isoform X1 n=1 Tax=Mercenaria mercenaria TaxID=6596 RepID=UPI00234E8488|nr:thymocyte nuclear protein 1-like isoform X1 [Mercenaria mercenaria]